jgi:hypothetical protein
MQLHCVKTCNTSNHRHHRHMGKACRPLCSSMSQQEIQIIGLTVQAPSSTNNDMLKVATLVQQNTVHSEAVSEKDKIMVITN